MKILSNDSFTSIEGLIQKQYDEGEYSKGWSYIFSKAESRSNPRLVTIGLNPGGGKTEHDWHDDAHLAYSTEGIQNAYFDQPWAADGGFTPLQKQIQLLRKLYYSNVPLEKILSFQFIPFRTPSWDDFPASERENAESFAFKLLDWTLAEINQDTTVISFGTKAVQHRLEDWFQVSSIEAVSVGWGNVSATVYDSPKCKRLIILPHLSRFRVIGRPQFTEADRIFI